VGKPLNVPASGRYTKRIGTEIKKTMWKRLSALFQNTLLLLFIAVEGAFAGNKFTTIGGGVSGSKTQKLAHFQELMPWAGGFLILVGLAALLTKNRYEGLIGLVTGKKFEAVTVVPLVLMVIGLFLIGLYFI
jgi:hypothetical protein